MTWKNNSMLSHPVKLFWNGWESNTYRLQEYGWEISAAESVEYRKMAISFRHKESNMRGISDYVDWDYYQNVVSQNYPVHMPTLRCQLANNITLQIQSPVDYDLFNPIDARPINKRIYQNISLDDLAHFRKIEKPSNEIFLKQASMEDILNMALSKQEPKQKQIRKDLIKRQEIEVMQNSQLKANLRLVV